MYLSSSMFSGFMFYLISDLFFRATSLVLYGRRSLSISTFSFVFSVKNSQDCVKLLMIEFLISCGLLYNFFFSLNSFLWLSQLSCMAMIFLHQSSDFSLAFASRLRSVFLLDSQLGCSLLTASVPRTLLCLSILKAFSAVPLPADGGKSRPEPIDCCSI